jgi:sulfate transport system ATP-binding protein
LDARLINDETVSAGRLSGPAPVATRGKPVDVSIEKVERVFGATAALHGVSLDIRAGELVALLGPSGSGKTTLLRILAGLDFPTAGRVMFAGEDALGLTVQQRNVGFVFQSYALFRHMTVFDNVAFGLKARPRGRRPSGAEIRARVLELIRLVRLEGLERRYPAQLSGGQRQRVALARALAIEPRILLLDEPFGALDAQVRRELRRWLRELHDATGHTTVFVTHDQEEAIELADRIVVLNDGCIEQVGTPDEVHDTPASPFVAGFIGESNTLPVERRAGRVLFAGQPLDLPPLAPADDGPATLVFRPHQVAVAEPGRAGVIVGQALSERRHGAFRRIDLDVDGARVEIDMDVAAPRPGRGERLAIRPLAAWVFPRASA